MEQDPQARDQAMDDGGRQSMERTNLDDAAAGGVDTGSGLSTADIASASAPTMTDDRRAVGSDDRTQADDRTGANDRTTDYRDQTSERQAATAATTPAPDGRPSVADDSSQNAPLFQSSDSQSLKSRWTDLQAGFVDEPRQTVEQADKLVAEVIQKLATSFADERSKLERQWDSGGDVSTEDLRLALRRYRSFFDRLLSM